MVKAEKECVHYWVIDSSNNRGTCKHCGAQRQFLSHRELRSWDDEGGEKGRKVIKKKRVHRKKDVIDH